MRISLTHTRHQEHFIVHGQTKQDTHENNGQEADDRANVVQVEGTCTVALDEHQLHRTKAGDHRQEEPCGGFNGHPQRPEHHHEQHQRQPHNEQTKRHKRAPQLS